MQVEVLPFSTATMDIATLNKVLMGLYKHTPARVVDSSPRPLSVPAKQLVSMAVAEDFRLVKAKDALQNSEPVQRHFLYGFIVLAPPGTAEQVLLLNTGLTLTVVNQDFERPAFILSGTLDVWKACVPGGLRKYNSDEVRMLFVRLHGLFERMGFSEIWHGYTRRPTGNGLYLLEGPK